MNADAKTMTLYRRNGRWYVLTDLDQPTTYLGRTAAHVVRRAFERMYGHVYRIVVAGNRP